MDPSGIIGIIGVAGQILATCTKLGLNWRDAPDDAKKFKSEIDGLNKTLWETYNHLIQNPDFISAFEGKHSAVLSNLAAPSNSDDSALLFTCKEELENVLKSLQKRLGGSRFGWERLKATFSNEKTQSAIENVQRRCQDINSKILIDNTTLAANTNIEVRSTRKHLEEKHLDEKKQKILDWITPIDFAAQQIDNLERRQEGTGQWLLESQEFQTWIEEDRKTLFCPGMPGAGKTMLSSIVIEHLQDRFGQDSTVGIAYVFCNFRRHDQQKPRDLLASILKQLYWAIPTGLNDVEQAYKRHESPTANTPMSTPEIISCLRSVMSCFDKVYILADALDEFRADEGYRDQLLKTVLGLSKSASVNIFATSRHIPEIESHFEDAPSVEIRATDEDVTKFLDGHMYKLPQAVRKSKELQGEIKHSIVQAVQGMFLLAQLHLDSLQGKRSAKAIKDALGKLATGSSAYDNAYDEAMERIEGQLPDEETLAKEALSWIVHATRPLKTRELQHALAVEIGTAELDEDNITDLEDIVSVCAGLIIIDEESKVIRLVHYTTQEYFERTAERWLPNAKKLTFDSCITYLSFDAFSCDLSDSDFELGRTLKYDMRSSSNPLFEYAAFEWGKHAQNISPPSERLLSFLMGRKANLDAVADGIWSLNNYYLCEDLDEVTGVSGLHLAAFFGLREAFTIVLERSGLEADINIQDSKELTPLSYAVMGGRVDFIEWLLSQDEIEVEPERLQYGYPPVTIAAYTGEVARILPFIESDKANLDARDEEWETPLMHAVMGDHADIVKALVESGQVDASLPAEGKGREWSPSRDGGTPLEMALKYFGRDHSITKLLLDRMEVIGISTGATIKAWEDVQRFPYVSIDDYDMMQLHKY
ncbi:Vegetative incompatibility protein HET-E-1 [Colletotrichum siamense]|uniref:Vegetative incompatibility protein HET-E-1 n=1 Tax=Colletotrichum siamense TaxID=690259 RepID=A0A9P5EPB5_COLSI|nr:Vegetative incompatibility protein HET-E-1 [Colletotrichum siamense]KAF4856371.1 Vegetative incompatibility protein HET-E-1 [Colletotrichum siamense]